MLDAVLSRFKQTLMKPESEQDYPWDLEPPTFTGVAKSPLGIILSLSVSLLIGGLVVMITLSARNRQMLESLQYVATPQNIQTLESQNQWSIEDRRILHEQNQRSIEDRERLNERLAQSEKSQAETKKALENAQRSFNEARDVLRRLEQTGKVKP